MADGIGYKSREELFVPAPMANDANRRCGRGFVESRSPSRAAGEKLPDDHGSRDLGRALYQFGSRQLIQCPHNQPEVRGVPTALEQQLRHRRKTEAATPLVGAHGFFDFESKGTMGQLPLPSHDLGLVSLDRPDTRVESVVETIKRLRIRHMIPWPSVSYFPCNQRPLQNFAEEILF